jgi:hypothetical protein
LESFSNCRVQGDVQILGDRDFDVPGLYPLFDPSCELVADNAVTYVYDILFRQLLHFAFDRQVP